MNYTIRKGHKRASSGQHLEVSHLSSDNTESFECPICFQIHDNLFDLVEHQEDLNHFCEDSEPYCNLHKEYLEMHKMDYINNLKKSVFDPDKMIHPVWQNIEPGINGDTTYTESANFSMCRRNQGHLSMINRSGKAKSISNTLNSSMQSVGSDCFDLTATSKNTSIVSNTSRCSSNHSNGSSNYRKVVSGNSAHCSTPKRGSTPKKGCDALGNTTTLANNTLNSSHWSMSIPASSFNFDFTEIYNLSNTFSFQAMGRITKTGKAGLNDYLQDLHVNPLTGVQFMRNKFICKYANCDYYTDSKTDLKLHCQLEHYKFKCDHCPIKFYRRIDCTRHMRDVHMDDKEVYEHHRKCPGCGLNFNKATDLIKHHKKGICTFALSKKTVNRHS